GRLRGGRDRREEQEEGGESVFHRRARSYNQLVSKRGQTFAAALAFAALIARPSAQAPSLDTVLKRTAAYVAEFRKQLSGIAAEETYVQEITHTARSANTFNVNPPRTLKSDLLLVKLPDSDRYVELRDVFEVDGEA